MSGFGEEGAPVLSHAVAQLAASLGVTPAPGASSDETASLLVARVTAVHGELVVIQRTLRRQAEELAARDKAIALREARCIAREKQLEAIDRLQSIASFEPAPVRRWWQPRG